MQGAARGWVVNWNSTRDIKVSSSDVQKVCDNGILLIAKLFCWTLPIVLDILKLYYVSEPGSDSFIGCKRVNDPTGLGPL
jgi:hypothetical protein